MSKPPAYIQTTTMYFGLGGGIPAEPCEPDDPHAVSCGKGSEFPYLRPLDTDAFEKWKAAGMSHNEDDLRAAGWLPSGECQ